MHSGTLYHLDEIPAWTIIWQKQAKFESALFEYDRIVCDVADVNKRRESLLDSIWISVGRI